MEMWCSPGAEGLQTLPSLCFPCRKQMKKGTPRKSATGTRNRPALPLRMRAMAMQRSSDTGGGYKHWQAYGFLVGKKWNGSPPNVLQTTAVVDAGNGEMV